MRRTRERRKYLVPLLRKRVGLDSAIEAAERGMRKEKGKGRGERERERKGRVEWSVQGTVSDVISSRIILSEFCNT